MLDHLERIQNPTLLFISRCQLTEPGDPHSHNYVELMYILSGNCLYMIGDHIYSLAAGDFLIIPANSIHHCTTITGSGPIDVFVMTLPAEQLPEASCTIEHTSPEIQPALCALAKSMQNEYKNKLPFFKMKLLSHFLDFIVLLLRDIHIVTEEIPLCTSLTSKEQHTLKAALLYTKQHYTETINLQQIAQSIPVSLSHLNRLFQKTLHISPMQYVIRLRLIKAKSLLKEKPGVSIKEVANLCGYSDTYHFSKIFKKHIGISPTDYRAGKRKK